MVHTQLLSPYLVDVDEEIKFGAVYHLLTMAYSSPGIVISLEAVNAIIEYYNQEGDYPTLTQLRQFVQNYIDINNDPESYSMNNSVKIGVDNLDSLRPIEFKDIEMIQPGDAITCMVCTDDINRGAKVYQLNPCKHVFHAEGCLDDNTSILTWLKTSKYCPTCRTEISIGTNKVKNSE